MKICFDGRRSQEIIQRKLDDKVMFECLSQRSNNLDLPIEYLIREIDEIEQELKEGFEPELEEGFEPTTDSELDKPDKPDKLEPDEPISILQIEK